MFLEMGANGLPALVRHIEEICNDIRDKKQISLLVREHTLADCLAQAKHSVSFHQLDLKDISLFKEIAHIAYWIAKLKPISIASPLTTTYLLNSFLDYYNQYLAISGGTVKVIKGSDEDDQAYKANLTLNINEHVAMTLIWEICEMHWAYDARRLAQVAQRQARESSLTRFRHLFFDELHPSLQTSLRLHSFTPRAFATTIECLLGYDLSPAV